jgi:hypothetical protein
MSRYQNKYLDMLKAENSKMALGQEPSKPSKLGFEGFEGTQLMAFSKISAPLDANGVPCGGCPNCGGGEFWRWPKFHQQHDHRCWQCCCCDPIPADSGPCDFCGVPDQMLKPKKDDGQKNRWEKRE